ncbi:MAG: sensor histidine kinase [Planctomycetota bacterium]|jgi:signal transduction histidine kinase
MFKERIMLGGAALLAALVLGYAVFSYLETGRKVLAAAEAEGRALLGAVSAGVERSLESSQAVERLLAERLLELGRLAGEDIARQPGREERLLTSFVVSHSLRGALLLDASFRVVASAGGPASMGVRPPPGRPRLSPARLEPIVEQDLIRRVREEGLGDEESVIVGFGENPFGTRVEFLVAVRMDATGGYLLLRQDAERLRNLREEAGVERLLEEAAASEAIAYLLLMAEDGTVLAASDPGLVGERRDPAPAHRKAFEGGVLDVSVPAAWRGSPRGTLRVGLAAEPVRNVLARARRSVILFSAIALVFGAGGIVALAVVERARRRKEAALEQELMARERAVSMGRLAAGVAHEIRGPLNAIGMAAQRLERECREGRSEPETVRAVTRAVREDVGRLNRTVEGFLDLGRIRPLQIGPVDVETLAREVVEAEMPGARIESPADAVEPYADRDELRKALANLVRNAREAAGDSPVVVAWRGRAGGVEIEVRDGGPGVPEEERERVFEHFYTGRPGGTGLGLAIVRAVALRHGGRMEVTEAPEGGACFTLTIPAGRRG